MQQTYQDRLILDPIQTQWMDKFADLYNSLQHKIYVHVSKGDNLGAIKPAFCVTNGISTRQFNAMSIELRGKILSTIELLKLNKHDIEANIIKTTTAIANAEKTLKSKSKSLDKEIRANIVVPSSESVRIIAKLKKDIAWNKKNKYGKTVRLNSLNNKLKNVDTRLKANVPGICFGTRKLFNQQFHLGTTEFGVGKEGYKNWLKAWKDARSHQFFLIGSRGEIAGNQSCKAIVVPSPIDITHPPTFNLIVKMPGALVEEGAPKFMTIENVHFEYGNDNFIAALESNTALSYRFHRDDRKNGWRVFVSTDVADQKITSIDADLGVVGIDFNMDHLAWSRTDNQGNPVDYGRIDLHLHGKSTEQREAILSHALDDVFKIASKFNNPIAIEDLDFSKKKSELSKLGVKRARMLSGLAYSKYKQLATSKASRLGVDVILVNPAYTSVAGNVKYAARLGCSIHQAAAGVIARRAQGYLDKLPKLSTDGHCTIRVPLMGNMAVLVLPAELNKSTHMTWVTIRRSLMRHCAGVVRDRKIASRIKSENMHHSSKSKELLCEPVKLLDRRNVDNELGDVPL